VFECFVSMTNLSSQEMATSVVAVNANIPNDKKLTFSNHLKNGINNLCNSLHNNVESIDMLIEILKLRIDAETEYSKNIENIITNYDFSFYENGTLKDCLQAMKADMKNEYTQRCEFATSLFEDVYQQLLKLRQMYNGQYKKFESDTKIIEKSFKYYENNYNKIKSKYDKICDDEQRARNALVNAKSSNEALKIGSKINSTMKTKLNCQDKYDEIKLIYNEEQIKYDNSLNNALNNIEIHETERIKCIHDALTKWAVFITNLSANRNYDVKTLAKQVSICNYNDNIQILIKNIMEQIKKDKLTNNDNNNNNHNVIINRVKKARKSLSHQSSLLNMTKMKRHSKSLSESSKSSPMSSDLLALSKETKKIKRNNSKKRKSVSLGSKKRSFSLNTFGSLFGDNSRNSNNNYDVDVVTIDDDDDDDDCDDNDIDPIITNDDNNLNNNISDEKSDDTLSNEESPQTPHNLQENTNENNTNNNDNNDLYQQMWDELTSMGFKEKHIKIGFKIYEKKLGKNYNIDTLIELVVNIQNVARRMKQKNM